MALLRLCKRWADARQGSVTALTVDHGLRPEAAEEALQVWAWCEAMGVLHEVLQWQPPTDRRHIQEKAREGRYALMTKWCKAQHVLHLLTAHTQDDQCETLFFRLARGSQVEGLAAMPVVSDMGGVRLLRPLLGASKAALVSTLEGFGQGWVEDASNQSGVYTRNHIRLQLVENADYEGLSKRAADMAGRFADIRNALFFNTVSCLTELVNLYPEGYATLDAGRFGRLAAEARMRVLGAVIPALTGGYHPPRAEALMLAQAAIAKGRKYSLGGMMFVPAQGLIRVAREASALPEAKPLPSRWNGMWDGRFAVSFDAKGRNGFFSIRPLGSEGVKVISGQKRLPSMMRVLPALRALPSLWHLDSLVSAPHMEYVGGDFGQVHFKAVYSCAKPLAGSPFFSFNRSSENPAQEI